MELVDPDLNLSEWAAVLFIYAPKYPAWYQLHVFNAEYWRYDANNCALRNKGGGEGGEADGAGRGKQIGFAVIV